MHKPEFSLPLVAASCKRFVPLRWASMAGLCHKVRHKIHPARGAKGVSDRVPAQNLIRVLAIFQSDSPIPEMRREIALDRPLLVLVSTQLFSLDLDPHGLTYP